MLAVHAPASNQDWARFQLEGTSGRSHETSLHDSRGGSWYTSGLPTPPGTRIMSGAILSSGLANYPPSHSYQQSRGYQDVSRSQLSQHAHTSSTGQYAGFGQTNDSDGYTEQNDINAIASYLQIPESVNNSKGSLVEFAAEVRNPSTLEGQWLTSLDHLPFLVRDICNTAIRRGSSQRSSDHTGPGTGCYSHCGL